MTKTDPKIAASMKRDTRRNIWRGIATSSSSVPLDTTTPGERGFRLGRALVPARFRR